jgi:long-chain acyl-CoA synthetase
MFWDLISNHKEKIAVIDERGQAISYASLLDKVALAAAHLQAIGSRQLGFLFIGNTLNSLIAYLACLQARHVPLLLSAGISPELFQSLQARYQPDWLMGAHISGVHLAGTEMPIINVSSKTQCDSVLGPELALLLSTSGSTGSPKLVRLSYSNLQTNAESISQYLALESSDRALTVLPPHYSYGLSVINSHLEAGASLVLRDVSVVTPLFAELIREHEVTSISGVPYIYQMLWRTGFQKLEFPTLRSMTQAGGRLDDKVLLLFTHLATERGWRFFTMYGQTEATARISYVPPDRLFEKLGSIGIPIPGGHLHIDAENSELIYAGANVMLGYASCRDDLMRADEQKGILRTGDIARQDAEGFFYITGRLKRFIKLAGNRIGLDEIEQQLQEKLAIPVMAAGRDELLVIWVEANDDNLIDLARQWLTQQFGIHHSFCCLARVDNLPLLISGKKDYTAMMVNI